MYRRLLATAVLGLIIGPPALAAPLDTASLETDPVYIAPGSVARFDQAVVRRELAGSRVAVVVRPFLAKSDDDEPVEKRLDEWSAANARPLVRVTGLQVRMASIDQWFAPGPADYRDLLERYDVTREVVRAIRHLRGVPATHEPWRPTVVPPDPGQVAAIVAGLKASRAYAEPGLIGVDMDRIAARLTGEPPYRVVRLRPLAGDREPDLLPALAAAFPGELIIVLRGSWLTATGLPPRRIAAGQAAQVTAGSLAEGSSASDAVHQFLRRVMSFERTPEKRPVDSGIDSGRTVAALAPWVFLLATVLIGGGSLMFWARRTRRERIASATSLATSGAETQSRLAKLGADLHDLDPGDDLISARRLADAAERYATARDLHDRADTPEEFEAVIATLVEGEAYTDVVRDRLGLPIRGARAR